MNARWVECPPIHMYVVWETPLCDTTGTKWIRRLGDEVQRAVNLEGQFSFRSSVRLVTKYLPKSRLRYVYSLWSKRRERESTLLLGGTRFKIPRVAPLMGYGKQEQWLVRSVPRGTNDDMRQNRIPQYLPW